MSASLDPTVAVRAALDNLAELLPYRDPQFGEGWDVDAPEFGQVWSQLVGAMAGTAEAMHRPRPGQGLAAIWLGAVAEVAARLEHEAQGLPCGWRDLLYRSNANITWLTREARQFGTRFDGGGIASGSLARLLQPEMTVVARLRALADKWRQEFSRAPREPDDIDLVDVVDRWQPWGRRRDEFVLRAGTLLLDMLDAVEVEVSQLGLAGGISVVLKSFHAPEMLANALLERPTANDLTRLIERLDSATSCGSTGVTVNEGHDVGVRKRDAAEYKPARDYPRDKWVYENVHRVKFQTLSKMLEEAIAENHWRRIKGRTSVKRVADKYAAFHRLEKHRSPDQRKQKRRR